MSTETEPDAHLQALMVAYEAGRVEAFEGASRGAGALPPVSRIHGSTPVALRPPGGGGQGVFLFQFAWKDQFVTPVKAQALFAAKRGATQMVVHAAPGTR